jgi:hypothetical protein
LIAAQAHTGARHSARFAAGRVGGCDFAKQTQPVEHQLPKLGFYQPRQFLAPLLPEQGGRATGRIILFLADTSGLDCIIASPACSCHLSPGLALLKWPAIIGNTGGQAIMTKRDKPRTNHLRVYLKVYNRTRSQPPGEDAGEGQGRTQKPFLSMIFLGKAAL